MKTMRHSCCSPERAAILRCKGGKHSLFLRKLSFLILFSFFASPSFSNNIRIEGVVSVSESSHSDTLLLSFSLRWDHSWRDEFNWDAAWVFLKYKTASGAWQPVYLSPRGHRFTDASGSALSFGSMEGETDGKTVGLIIYRTTLEGGNTPEIRCHLLCPRSSLGGLAAEAFERNEAFILAQGIEMVYIPYGAYYVGDSSSFHTIADAVGHPILVDSEEGMSVSAGGSSYTLSASYPKGYKGFYVMKYEVSQEQYVTFLNNLTYTQQQERVPGLASFSKGDYIFGDASQPSSRNGIIVAVSSEGGSPVIFANNLNNDTKYSQGDDGKTLACNYLSPEDMTAYLSWSGLRPMSELEYEKACRAPYPEMPVGREYAWHENSSLTFLSSVLNGGSGSERSNTTGANVNAGNRFPGPVRCGLFATGSSSQRDAGASFWGVMEMSGNLRELCYNVNAANVFSGDVYGDGTYNKSRWSTVVSHLGVRGGGFSSVDSLLRVSDRSEAESYFTSLTQRDSTVGFRGVRTVSAVSVDGGEIGASDTACWSGSEIRSIRDAGCTDMASLSFSYLWYVKKPGNSVYEIIPGEVGSSLFYRSFKNKTTSAVTYIFKRRALVSIGEGESNEVEVTILPEPFVDSAYVFEPCPVAIPHQWKNIERHWYVTGSTDYILHEEDNSVIVSNLYKQGTYTLNVSWGRCQDVFSVPVQVTNTLVLSAAQTFGYTGNVQCVVLPAGKYEMEAWGAKGGGNGAGGYVKGEINLTQLRMIYIYVGQAGGSGGGVGSAGGRGAPASFNGGGGGGNGYTNTGYGSGGSAGGGASDIRLEGGAWKEFNSLRSRLIVAAGGGGIGSNSYPAAAGGLIGYNSNSYGGAIVYGATQTSGYALGLGGTGASKYTGDGWDAEGNGGGGGGYYGGYASLDRGKYSDASGAGGSSFISGHAGCDAISISSTSGNMSHTGQPKHYSGFYFTNTVMIDGQGYQWTTVRGSKVNMPNLAGTGTMVGNLGNGQVKITPLH